MKNHDDYKESPTMREVHQIQEELEQQYQKSGLSFFEWLQATEDDFQKSLTEDGFRMVTRNGQTFIEEIESQSKRGKNKQKTIRARQKNYDDYIDDSTMRELHLIREKMEQQYRKSGLPSYEEWLQATDKDLKQSLAEVGFQIVTHDGRTYIDKIKPQTKKKLVKYKTAVKRKKKNFRKK